jgi:hypothetical protein
MTKNFTNHLNRIRNNLDILEENWERVSLDDLRNLDEELNDMANESLEYCEDCGNVLINCECMEEAEDTPEDDADAPLP